MGEYSYFNGNSIFNPSSATSNSSRVPLSLGGPPDLPLNSATNGSLVGGGHNRTPAFSVGLFSTPSSSSDGQSGGSNSNRSTFSGI